MNKETTKSSPHHLFASIQSQLRWPLIRERTRSLRPSASWRASSASSSCPSRSSWSRASRRQAAWAAAAPQEQQPRSDG
eukprot:10233118-Heterocapsa_arctica.AAC.1